MVDKEAEIDVHQNLTVLSRLVFALKSRVKFPDSIIAQCLQTSLSRDLARGGDG